MFIKEQYDADLQRVTGERPPLYREQNVGWPSEALANVGPFATGECRRALFYKALGIPYTNKMSVRVRHICDAGIMYESKAIRRFKESSKFVKDQTRIEFTMPHTQNKVVLSGKLDVVIRDEGIVRGIEIKTVDGYKADKIFGARGGLALPAPNNLMQSMLYKYRTKQGEVEGLQIDEMYLMYINRGNMCTMYFLVDIDDAGYPILTPITMEGVVKKTIRLAEKPSFDDWVSHSTGATSEQARVSDLKININNVFNKFDQTYLYIKEKALPPMDYSMIYNNEQLNTQLHCGRISKMRYNKHKKGETTGDARCSFCNYKTKCLADQGIRLKKAGK